MTCGLGYRGAPHRVWPAAVLLAVSTAALPAAGTPKECIEQHSRATELRSEAKLIEAKATFAACVQDEECPSEVTRECAAQIEQLKNEIPSLIFAAVDESGNDTVAVRVSVNGQTVLEELALRAIEFDPGRYQLRFEGPNGSVKEDTVIVRVGERNRRVFVDFRPAGTGPQIITPPDPPPSAEKPGLKPIPVASYVLGGVGVLALGSFAYFAFDGKQRENDMFDTCAPPEGSGCSQSDVDAMRRSYLIADISLGIGVVSLGAATIVWLATGTSEAAPAQSARLSPRLGAAPLPGGFSVSAGAHF